MKLKDVIYCNAKKKKKEKKKAGAKSTEGQKGHFAPPALIGVQGEPRQIPCKRKNELERN